MNSSFFMHPDPHDRVGFWATRPQFRTDSGERRLHGEKGRACKSAKRPTLDRMQNILEVNGQPMLEEMRRFFHAVAELVDCNPLGLSLK